MERKNFKSFKRKYGINFLVDPNMEFEEIPLPYRARLFSPGKRKKGDPLGWEKKRGKVKEI